MTEQIEKSYGKSDTPYISSLQEETPMQIFYKDKGIFLTGATGFFGKVIIEKLLRVTEVGQIYLLVRQKKGKDAFTRIEELFNDPLFDQVKKINPKFQQKLKIISGDVSQMGLGISPREREIISENVNIIIHGAATVRFDEKLRVAIAINVHGTKEILKLAKEVVHLKAIVHVSTAFAHCNRRYIQERFYKGTMSGEKGLKLADCLDETTLNSLTQAIIKGYPNTYTFTKVLAEDIVEKQTGQLPLAIFRPGIVITTCQEPIKGWIDNMYGPVGLIIGVATGVLRVFTGNMEQTANIVPVDMTVNALLTCAWDIARNKYDQIPIYNYIPDPENAITWKKYVEDGFKMGCNFPTHRSIWYPRLTIAKSEWLYNVLFFLYQTLPAIFMDLVMLMIGKKPRMLNVYRKIRKYCSVLVYFSENEFNFDNDNVRTLLTKMDKSDKQLFAFDMRNLNWSDVVSDCLYGIRLNVLKEDPSTIPSAIKRYNRLKILHYTVVYFIYGLVALAVYYFLKVVLF